MKTMSVIASEKKLTLIFICHFGAKLPHFGRDFNLSSELVDNMKCEYCIDYETKVCPGRALKGREIIEQCLTGDGLLYVGGKIVY